MESHSLNQYVKIDNSPFKTVGKYKIFKTNYANLYISNGMVEEFFELFNNSDISQLKYVQNISEIVYIVELLKPYNISIIFADYPFHCNLDKKEIERIDRQLFFKYDQYNTNLYALWFISNDVNVKDVQLIQILNDIVGSSLV